MTDKEYKEWEVALEKSEKRNNNLLIEFKEYLTKKGLSQKTIDNHILNIEFFANGFLLRYDIIPIEEGFSEIGSFLGDYFIRKSSWASKYTIQENIASFKKFYTFLNEKGMVTNDELSEMKMLIKDEKQAWIEEVEWYWNNLLDQ